MKCKLAILLVVLFLVPIVYGISIELSSPSEMLHGETGGAAFTIQSDTKFNGVAYIYYKNIQSLVSASAILNTSFSGGEPYTYRFEWYISGAEPGEYEILIDLKNENNITLATGQIQGIVNSSAPEIISMSPVGVVTSRSTTLIAETNENAICKYSISNTSYTSLSYTFQTTGGLIHTQALTGLEGGTKTYYVGCSDFKGHEMYEPETIEFKVDLPPTAEIILSSTSPLKMGIIEVSVVTSENINEAPKLEYSFHNSPNSKKFISLVGSDSLWKGYMVIVEEYDNNVGTFFFSGKDNLGTIGNIITKGKSFIVDTTPPPALLSIEAVSKGDGQIELEWYYEGEHIDYFKIYRSTSSGVDYVDYFTETSNITKYTDGSTEDKVTYYYKINAIDEAGNAGPLSEEVYATAVKYGYFEEEKTETESGKVKETPKVLPPNLVIKVNDEIKKIEKLLIDIEEISSDFGKGEYLEMISDLELINRIESSETELNRLKDQLNNLKLDYKTESELDSKLNNIELEIRKISQTTPRDIVVIEKSSSIQSSSRKDIDLAVEKLFSTSDLSSIDKDKYKRQSKQIQDNIEISVNIYVVEVEFMDGEKTWQTLIIKSISHRSPEPLKDVILFEIIPKEIAETISEIDFLTKNYEVIEEDPIVKFGFSQLDFEGTKIKYSINRKLSIDNAKKTVSVVLIGPIQLEQSFSKITGFSVASVLGSGFGFGKKEVLFSLFGVLLIGALISYQIMLSGGYSLPDSWSIKNLSSKGSKLKSKLMPERQRNSFAKSSRKKDEYEVITELIRWGHRHIDNNEVDQAKKIYPKIELLYRGLSAKNRPEIFKKCTDLQRRINKGE